MQVVMSFLHSNGYVHDFYTNDVTNELKALFFVHPTSFKIWRAFPHVLMIDATYKTNKYNMPFVEIVGVTSTRKTFCIAFAFISEEKMDNYKWVLECLKLTLDECILPRVIITDRDLALMNACKKKLLEDSPTWISYMENYKQLQLVLRKYPRVLSYVDDNWLNNHKEKFVSAWCDQSFNFGNRTTNRVESQHAKLKNLLRGFVSNKALDMILGELHRLNDLELNYSACGCQLRKSCGLPCEAIPLDSVDIFWRTLDVSWSTPLEHEDIQCDDELHIFKETFNKQSNAGKKSLLRRLGIADFDRSLSLLVYLRISGLGFGQTVGSNDGGEKRNLKKDKALGLLGKVSKKGNIRLGGRSRPGDTAQNGFGLSEDERYTLARYVFSDSIWSDQGMLEPVKGQCTYSLGYVKVRVQMRVLQGDIDLLRGGTTDDIHGVEVELMGKVDHVVGSQCVCAQSTGCKKNARSDNMLLAGVYLPGIFHTSIFSIIMDLVIFLADQAEIWISKGLLDKAKGNILVVEIIKD
ncbi:FAR1-related sequence 5-like protein [Tanacetum coccineum]|uniref:FAR1-related sequence 5-like protein n=1 Tax=Tanacetum coccineum TaxID=301880 RepID=A0ABQ5IPR7_9ASTR